MKNRHLPYFSLLNDNFKLKSDDFTSTLGTWRSIVFNVLRCMNNKARDQKQIYRLNETVSHWGLNPPP